MSLKDKEKWNRKYRMPGDHSGEAACEWLADNTDLLTGAGRALDVAAGAGRNAVFAAEHGYDVLAVDISEVGLEKARARAAKHRVSIRTETADLDAYRFEENAFDLILCFNFLDRGLFPGLRQALKPGGLIFYETFNLDHLKYTSFRQEWVLKYNELLRVFQDYRILRYREVDSGLAGIASLVARKPSA
ncbi:MAG: methyltransferase domain-containing protein [Nitrospinaceae bacterium]|jgi:SAM-dependent methyltransferase|nr:MAG: methyltransferase domain-containing protein [Nitrospinaceae bacterium]